MTDLCCKKNVIIKALIYDMKGNWEIERTHYNREIPVKYTYKGSKSLTPL